MDPEEISEEDAENCVIPEYDDVHFVPTIEVGFEGDGGIELSELSILFDSNVSITCSRLKLVLLLIEFVDEPWWCNNGGVGRLEEEDNCLVEEE